MGVLKSKFKALYGKNYKKGGDTQPPRTRPGKAYPGGKHRRRAFAKLAMRKQMREEGIAVTSRDRPGIAAMHANIPGSMKG